jgi:serine/threonine protein phosphatase 1
VLDRVLDLKSRLSVTCVRGNHELMMARSRTDKGERRDWLSVGGAATLASYSSVPGRIADVSAVPDGHWDFVDNGVIDFVETESVLFVHANLFPNLPLAEQNELMLFWEPLTRPIRHQSGKTVVCGHTAQSSGRIWDLGTTVCIDTAAYKGGKLTCLDVTTWHYWQADVMGRVTEGYLSDRETD